MKHTIFTAAAVAGMALSGCADFGLETTANVILKLDDMGSPQVETTIEIRQSPVESTLDDANSHEVHQDAYTWFTDRLGISEVPGPGNNNEIVQMHQTTSLKAEFDSVPWCSSALNAAIIAAGVTGTNSARARSWMEWGKSIDIENAMQGDIVVLWRGSKTAKTGHVGLIHKIDSVHREVFILGGNQSDSITISSYPLERILGVRRFTE